jgi:hypothetical protein
MLSLAAASAQGNHVFSGAELVNFSVADIAVTKEITWSTDRNSLPGYFSVVDTATYTGCTDAVNIDGYIKKYGKGAFIFPVGNGKDLRTLEISSPALATDAYATAWILGDPGVTADPTGPNAGLHPVNQVQAPLAMVSTTGQWDWQAGDNGNLGTTTTGTGSGLTITVSIPDMTRFANSSDLRLAGWNGASWIDLSGNATANGNTENSELTGMMQAGITAVAIASISKQLPFNLDSFIATAADCRAVLSWTTSNEAGISSFVAEQSFDNVHFTAVSSVGASGINGVFHYNITATQASGKSYYRLKIIGKDGPVSYSKVIECLNTCSDPEYMKVYPNPVTSYDRLFVKFGTAYRGNATLIIYNAIGQKIIENHLIVSNADNLVTLAVRSFASGGYFVSLLTDKGKLIGSVQKIIKL